MIVAGVGCRRGCPASEIAALVREAEARAGRRAVRLAAPAFKQSARELHGAAAMLGLPLDFVSEESMIAAQERCVTRSAAAASAKGLASIAEAAALAASDGALLLPRIKSARATCALAGP